EERDTLDYTPAFDIQAGNNTSSQHDLPNLPRCLVALLDLLSFDFFELLAQSRRQRVDHLNIAPIQLAQMGGMLALSLVDMADPASHPLFELAHPAIQSLQPGLQLAQLLLICLLECDHLVILLMAHLLKPLLVHQEALGRNTLYALDFSADLRQLTLDRGNLGWQLLGD